MDVDRIIGFATYAAVVGTIFLIFSFLFEVGPSSYAETADDALLVLSTLVAILYLALLPVYILNTVRNHDLSGSSTLWWVAFHVLAPALAFPMYFQRYIQDR